MALHLTSDYPDNHAHVPKGLIREQTSLESCRDDDQAIYLGLPLKCRVTRDGLIIDAEPNFLEFFGLGRCLIETTALADALRSLDKDLLLNHLAQANNWGYAHFELRFAGTEGDIRWLECVIRQDHGQNAIQVCARDMSPVIEHLGKYSALRERYDDISYLLRVQEVGETLAHELNQPLAAISNYCTGALGKLRGKVENSGEICDALEKAVSQITRASKVISQLRSTLKRPALNMGRCSLANLVSDSLAILVADAKRRGAVFLVNLQPQLPDVRADAALIGQILTKFVHASLETMLEIHASSAICLSAKLGCGRNSGSIEVSVGITPPTSCDHPHLVSRDAPRSFPEFNICQSIVELHRGRLWIAVSKEGTNTFYFTLPVE